jgi:hypothetical protein
MFCGRVVAKFTFILINYLRSLTNLLASLHLQMFWINSFEIGLDIQVFQKLPVCGLSRELLFCGLGISAFIFLYPHTRADSHVVHIPPPFFFFFFEKESHYVTRWLWTQDLLPTPSKCRNYQNLPPHPTHMFWGPSVCPLNQKHRTHGPHWCSSQGWTLELVIIPYLLGVNSKKLLKEQQAQ